ncbi:MAG: hypothetical protein ABFS12_02920 [Bacteroidota bacterium]
MLKQFMSEKNLINRPLIIIGLAILFLFAISFLPDEITIFGIEIKSVDILEDLKRDDANEEIGKVQNFNNQIFENIVIYSSTSLFSFDHSNKVNHFIKSEIDKFEETISKPTPDPPNSPLEGNIKQLKHFFEALKNAKNSQVRIAHYGDSSLEGDLITAYLRNKFQKQFGGKGVGYLPITSQDINFRETTKINFSDDWISASITGNNSENLSVGIAGKGFLNSKGSWVEYSAIPKFRSTRNFDIVRVFYTGLINNSELIYSLNGTSKKSIPIYKSDGISEAIIKEVNSTSVKLTFPEENSTYIFGVSLEDTNGVYIDNLPLRGCSGVALKKIPRKTLKEFNSILNYQLVILEFGLNILSGRKTNFKKYEQEMTEVITEFKKSFPNTSFLLVGVHDKSIKKKKKFVTDPEIKKLIQSQKNIAKNTDIAFWNLFEAMGGENSMQHWVDANPPLAYSDYTHFTSQGTKKEAEMLFKSIMNANRQL